MVLFLYNPMRYSAKNLLLSASATASFFKINLSCDCDRNFTHKLFTSILPTYKYVFTVTVLLHKIVKYLVNDVGSFYCLLTPLFSI